MPCAMKASCPPGAAIAELSAAGSPDRRGEVGGLVVFGQGGGLAGVGLEVDGESKSDGEAGGRG